MRVLALIMSSTSKQTRANAQLHSNLSPDGKLLLTHISAEFAKLKNEMTALINSKDSKISALEKKMAG